MDGRLRHLKSIKPVIFLSRIHGVLPVTITKNFRVSVSGFGIVYSILAVAVSCSIGYFDNFITDASWGNNIILMSAVVIQFFGLHLSCLLYTVRAKHIRKMFRQMFSLRKTFLVKNRFWVNMFAVTAHGAHIIFCYAFTVISVLKKPNVRFNFAALACEYFMFNALFLINLQFLNCLIFARDVFKIFNLSIKPSVKDLSKLSATHGRVCSYCDSVLQSFGLSFLFNSLSTFCIFLIYGFIFMSLKLHLLVASLETVQIILQLGMVLYAAEKVVEEVTMRR